jgi:hypothetical protein
VNRRPESLDLEQKLRRTVGKAWQIYSTEHLKNRVPCGCRSRQCSRKSRSPPMMTRRDTAQLRKFKTGHCVFENRPLREKNRPVGAALCPGTQTSTASCAGLTRASSIFTGVFRRGWIAGSSPAMTTLSCPGRDAALFALLRRTGTQSLSLLLPAQRTRRRLRHPDERRRGHDSHVS